MMNKFIDWLNKHEAEFTGFCVGLNFMAGIHAFGKGWWLWSLVSFSLVVFMIAAYKKGKVK
jgi:hypothetical protein